MTRGQAEEAPSRWKCKTRTSTYVEKHGKSIIDGLFGEVAAVVAAALERPRARLLATSDYAACLREGLAQRAEWNPEGSSYVVHEWEPPGPHPAELRELAFEKGFRITRSYCIEAAPASKAPHGVRLRNMVFDDVAKGEALTFSVVTTAGHEREWRRGRHEKAPWAQEPVRSPERRAQRPRSPGVPLWLVAGWDRAFGHVARAASDTPLAAAAQEVGSRGVRPAEAQRFGAQARRAVQGPGACMRCHRDALGHHGGALASSSVGCAAITRFAERQARRRPESMRRLLGSRLCQPRQRKIARLEAGQARSRRVRQKLAEDAALAAVALGERSGSSSSESG